MAAATYYRWEARAQTDALADRSVPPRRQALPPTPVEVDAVCAFALRHPTMGYKRLAWLMIDEDVACLRPYQVYRVLLDADLLARRPVVTEELRQPEVPTQPDQVWHIDLMYLYVRPRWYYLVDILDGYSRFLVHWSLNRTLGAEAVTLTIQQALDGLEGRRPGCPLLIHDHGAQFLSAEWRRFVIGAGLVDVKTRVAHPESNGRLERLHRTHREEGVGGYDLSEYYQAVDALTRWSHYYNYRRPHSALGYMPPIEYYRGDPQARWGERRRKLAQATEARRVYWRQSGHGRQDPHIIERAFCLTS
ncbi:MAG: integrase core domain-containing protein [Armatimonadota bacterium]|nr:integrase core domain-containing protein [Armatimonadota bacterium]